MDVEFAVQARPVAWLVEQLDIRSEFIRVNGSGDPNRGQLNLSADLRKLQTQLDQLFDMRGVVLGGQVNGKIKWHNSQDVVDTTAELNGNQLQVATGNRMWIDEPQFRLTAQAASQRAPQRQLNAAKLQIEMPGGQISAGDEQQ